MRATLSISLVLAFACTDAAPTFEELGESYTMEEEIAASEHLPTNEALEAIAGADDEVERQLERLAQPVEAEAPSPTAIPHVAGLNERLGYDPFDPSQDACAMALHAAGTPGDHELEARCRALDTNAQRCLLPLYRPQTPSCEGAIAGLSASDREAFAPLLRDDV